MNAPSTTTDTRRPMPTPEPTGWSLTRFFKREWSLLLLAAILTAIVWDTMRSDVTVSEQVWLPLEIPADRTVLFDRPSDGVELAFDCPRSKLRTIKGDQGGTKSRLRLVVGEPPTRGFRLLNDRQDKIEIPFPAEYLQGGKHPLVDALGPNGWVYRLTPTDVTIVKPPLTRKSLSRLAEENIEALISVTSRTITLDAPPGGTESTIVPDAIDITPYLEAEGPFDGEHGPIPLTFDQWTNDVDKTDAIRVWRKQVELPTDMGAKLTLRKRIRKGVTNEVVFLVPEAYRYEFNFDSMPNRPPATSKYTGQLTGRTDVLDRLAQPDGLSKWYWGIRVVDVRELPQDASEGEKTVRATIEWVALHEFQNLGVRFAPDEDYDFSLKVERRPE